MIDSMWRRLLPQVLEEQEFHTGVLAGRQHWWDDWQGKATATEIAAFLSDDWSYVKVLRRNQDAQTFGLPLLSEAYVVGFVWGWFAAVYGD